MVEDDGVELARRGSQHPPDHLPVKAHPLRRAGEDATTDIGQVPAFGQHHARAHDVDVSGRETRKRRVTLRLGCRAIEVLSADAGDDELVAQVDRVLDVDREGDRLPALAELMPMTDDVADELRLIHRSASWAST